MARVEFDYFSPNELAENLWEVRGKWSNKLGRRMTVIRLSGNRLVLHSSIQLEESELAWLQSLGAPSFIVAPNIFHCSDADWMAEKFPAAEVFVPASKLAEFTKKGFQPKDVNSQFPALLANELKCIPMRGTRIDEAAFLHVPSKTLILCDLAFNMDDVFSGLEKWVMKWNKVGGRFGPSRITKWLFAKNQRALVESYEELLKHDFDRVIVNHGEVLDSGGREKLRSGVELIFGKI